MRYNRDRGVQLRWLDWRDTEKAGRRIGCVLRVAPS